MALNPVYDCSYTTSLEDMKLYMQGFDKPSILVDDRGKLLGRNKLATYKLFPVRVGGYTGSFLPPAELQYLRHMQFGEMRQIQLRVGAAVAAKFCCYYFIALKANLAERTAAVLKLNSEVNETASAVFSYCIGAERDRHEAVRSLLSEQMCRQHNCSKMLELVTGSNKGYHKEFNPYNVSEVVCDVASRLDGAGEADVQISLDRCVFLSRGNEEDYCSLLAAMVSFGIGNRATDTVRITGAVKHSSYRFDVEFKSSVPPSDIQMLLLDSDGASSASLGVRADIMYMRSLADNSFWMLELKSLADGEVRLSLSVPIVMPKAMTLAQQRPEYKLRGVAEIQLAAFIVTKFIPTPPFFPQHTAQS